VTYLVLFFYYIFNIIFFIIIIYLLHIHDDMYDNLTLIDDMSSLPLFIHSILKDVSKIEIKKKYRNYHFYLFIL